MKRGVKIKPKPLELTPAVTALQEQAQNLLHTAGVGVIEIALKQIESEGGVRDEAELARVNALLHSLKGGRRNIVDLLATPKVEAHRTHESICAVERALIKPIDRLIDWANRLMAPYVEKRIETAEKQQQQLAEDAEKLRKEKQRDADRLALEGNIPAAMQLKREAETLITPVTPIDAVRLDGTSIRRPWDAKVTDLMALVKAVAAGKVPLETLEPNLTYLRAQATENSGLEWPGVEAWQKTQFSSRLA